MSYVVGFAVVFAMAVIFTVLTIVRQSKFSAVWATLGFAFWFALAGINGAVFAADTALVPLGYLWFAVGVVIELVGIVITLLSIRVDQKGRDLEI